VNIFNFRNFVKSYIVMNFTSTSNLLLFENNALLCNLVYNMRMKSMHKCVSIPLPAQVFRLQIY